MDISLIEVSKSYGTKRVLSELSMTLPEGESTCIMGPSGCGKSTLLHILMGLVVPDAGEVLGILGKTIAPVFQENRLCENLSIRANLQLTAANKLPIAELQMVLDELCLDCSMHMPVKKLSGGMKRRVAIARALMSEKEVWIFDEPLQGLDRMTKEKTMDCIQKRRRGRTLIWVSHDVWEAQYLNSAIYSLPLPQRGE